MSDKIKVLAVDDAPVNLMIVKGCLKGGDFELTTSTNALDALQKFKENYFDIVLLDVIMPGIDGFELRKLIREVDKERPVIFLTAMVDDGSMTMLNQIAWDSNTYYLNKVIDKKTLIQKIREVVNIHRTRQLDRMYSSKLESELKLAGDLQKILLPDWCILDDHALISSIYAPAMQVSGDIFDLIPMTDSKYLLFIGDIAGHGISAALYMATIQAYLKVRVHEENFNLQELLSGLNRFFCKELRGQTYMTALAAMIDFEKNHITVHSAGHPGLLMGSPSKGTFRRSDDTKGGLPLGWFPDSQYLPEDSFETDFADDTIFVGVTDGVFDTTNEDGECIPQSEYEDIIRALLADTDATIFPYRLKETMAKMGYYLSPDDFTVVALRKRHQETGSFLGRLIAPELPNVNKVAQEFSSLTSDLREASQIELCVHEYLNNVILHGSDGLQKKQESIYISIEKKDEQFIIRGVEQGQPWDPTASQESVPGSTEENPYATSGRGLQILQAITDYVSYNSYCGVNETSFVLKKGGAK